MVLNDYNIRDDALLLWHISKGTTIEGQLIDDSTHILGRLYRAKVTYCTEYGFCTRVMRYANDADIKSAYCGFHGSRYLCQAEKYRKTGCIEIRMISGQISHWLPDNLAGMWCRTLVRFTRVESQTLVRPYGCPTARSKFWAETENQILDMPHVRAAIKRHWGWVL